MKELKLFLAQRRLNLCLVKKDDKRFILKKKKENLILYIRSPRHHGAEPDCQHLLAASVARVVGKLSKYNLFKMLDKQKIIDRQIISLLVRIKKYGP